MNYADHLKAGGDCQLTPREDTLDREPWDRIYQDPVDGSWCAASSIMDMEHGEGWPDWRGEAHWSAAQRAAVALSRALSEPVAAALAVDVRSDRDGAIRAVQWMKDRHADEIAMGVATTLSDDAYGRLLEYIQALREITAQAGFPTEIDWPVLTLTPTLGEE